MKPEAISGKTPSVDNVAVPEDKNVILVPMSKSANWRDLGYLAAVPASSKVNSGKPVVLALDEHATLRPETSDFLRRYKPDRTYVLNCFSQPEMPADGLVHWWRMDEGKGNEINSSASKHTGRVHRLPVYTKDVGAGYSFNGQSITVDQGSMPGSTRELTVAFWMKADKVDHQTVISKDEPGDRSPGWRVMLRNGREGNALRFRVGGGRDTWHHTDLAVRNAYKAGEWVHVACTHSAGTSKVYLNGKLRGTRKNITYATVNNGYSPMMIEHDYYGAIDEVRVYDRVLDELEVQRLPSEQSTAGKGLLGYWPMDDTAGNLAKDKISENHFHWKGTPDWVKGKIGGALRLKTEKDHLLIPSNSDSLKPLTVTFDITPNSEQDCTILSKRGTADRLPPWSVSLETRTLVFRIGDKGAELRAEDACKPGKKVSVVATFDSKKMTLAVSDVITGRLPGSENKLSWSADGRAFREPRCDGEVSNIKMYDCLISNDDNSTAQRPVAAWTLGKELGNGPTSTWGEGKNSGGLKFGGDGTYAECPMPDSKSDELTLSFWVKPSKHGCVLSRQSYESGKPGWGVFLEKNRQTLVFELDGRSRRIGHAEAFHFNRWTHITITYAKGIISFYKDGRRIQRADRTDKGQPRLRDITAPLRMGALLPGKKHFEGILDDVTIFDRAVSDKEARGLYGATPLPNDTRPIAAKDAANTACNLANAFWNRADRVVCTSADKYQDALVASALAARLQVPLLFFGKHGYSTETKDTITSLKPREVLLIGDRPHTISNQKTTVLTDHLQVLNWMKDNGLKVNYLAAVNPRDRQESRVRKVSLAGPLLAAGRQGAVAILDFETQWKLTFDGKKKTSSKVAGAPDSTDGWLTGNIDLDGKDYPFVLTSIEGKGYNRFSIDRGKGYEGPFRTAKTMELNDRIYSISINRSKKSLGERNVQLTWPATDEVNDRFKECYKTMGYHPEYLCILGRPDVIPQALVITYDIEKNPGRGHIRNMDDLPNDIPYGDADADPFLEVAVGRLVAEDVWSATLTASRGLVYDDLLDPSWTKSCATACWVKYMDEQFRNVGFEQTPYHDGKSILDDSSPLRNVVAISHAEHSAWMDIGKLVHWQSEVLLAPLVLESGGCSVMRLVEDSDWSAPIRLLRNGAVAVLGNTRDGIGAAGHYTTELWYALLSGKSVGQAHRYAINRFWLNALEKGPKAIGHERYQIYNRTLFGDPAVTMYIPDKSKLTPAQTNVDGNLVTVTGPEKWWTYDQKVSPEWGYNKTPTLLVVRGQGVGIESYWSHAEKYDVTSAYYTAEVRTRQPVTKVEQIDAVPEPLGWTKQFWVDEHQDGSRSILWRVRLVDIDRTKDAIHKEAKNIRYRLTP